MASHGPIARTRRCRLSSLPRYPSPCPSTDSARGSRSRCRVRPPNSTSWIPWAERRCLGKNDRLFGNSSIGLNGMIDVVQQGRNEMPGILPTHGPRRTAPRRSGNFFGSALRTFVKPLGDSVSPAISGTIFDRSRILPSASMMPGFSRRGGPKERVSQDSPLGENGQTRISLRGRSASSRR